MRGFSYLKYVSELSILGNFSLVIIQKVVRFGKHFCEIANDNLRF